MLKRLSLSVVALSLLPAAVFAHGPSRLKSEKSVEINAPAAKVWARISNFDDASWIPAVVKTEGNGGNVPDSSRHLTLKSGGTIEEILLAYDAEEMSYKYKMFHNDPKVFPVNNYSSSIKVSAVDAKTCTVEWKAGYYRGYPNNDPPPELNDDASQAAVDTLFESTLAALKASVESGK